MKIITLLPIALLTLAGCAANKHTEEPVAPEPVVTDIVEEKPALVSEVEEQPVQAQVIAIKVKPPEPARTTTVLFDFDSSQLNEDDREIIRTHAKFLTENPEFIVKIEGHTDERGSQDYNKRLGVERANVIRNELIDQGVQSKQVAITSYGEEKPKSQGQNESAWAANRRAIFVYSDNLAKNTNIDAEIETGETNSIPENDNSVLADIDL